MAMGGGAVDNYSLRNFEVKGALQDAGVKTTLTNLTARSDALGKPIPRTFGHVVVGGALVWASPYYIRTQGFTQETQYYSEKDFYFSDNKDTTTLNGTKVTLLEKSQYGIDLCYSFGFEGSTGSRRKVSKFRINGVEVYDGLTNKVMAGIGFDIREASDLDIPAAMAKYELSGKYFYPGQTLIVLQQFNTADWGGALPQSVEVEFVAETALGQSSITNIVAEYPENVAFQDVNNTFMEPDYRRIYVYNKVPNALHVFNMDTGEFLETIPVTGPAADTLKNSGNNMNVGRNTLCGELRVVTAISNGFGSGMFIDLLTGQCDFLGTDGINAFMCLTSDSSTAYLIGSSLNSEVQRVDIRLVRNQQTGSVTVASTQGGGLPWSGWWEHGHGYGKGFAVCHRNNKFALFAADGSYKTITLAQEHLDRGAGVNSIVAYKGGFVAYVRNGVDQASQYLIAYNADGSVRTQKNVNQFFPTMRYEPFGNGPSRPSDRYFGISYLEFLYYTDLVNLTVTQYPSNINYDFGFDPVSNKVYGPSSTQTLFANGPALLDEKVKIIDLIRDLYHTAGIYDRNNVTGSADLTETVTGVMLVDNIDVIQFVDQLCQLYRIQKTETGIGAYFYKTRTQSLGVKLAATIDISELAVDIADDNNTTPIQSERASTDTAPTAITLKFIDPANSYKENSVSWRRSDADNANGQEQNIALPLVLTAEEALTLVQTAVVDSTAAVFTHRFRLPPRLASYLMPGDIVAIVDGPYKTTLDIDLLDLNGDLSGSVEGTSIGAVNIAFVPVPALTSPIKNPVVAGGPSSVGYIIDAPALTYGDMPKAGEIIVYESITSEQLAENYQGGYFGRRLVDGNWGSLPTFVNNSQTIVFRAKSILTDKRWTVDKDELTIQRISGKLPANKTLTQLQTDPLANIAFYGKPGRWEVIKFCSAEGGKLSGGIMRGLKGTEINCGKHAVDDLIICVPVNIIAETRLTDVIGKPEEWKAVSVGKSFNSAPVLGPFTLEGNSSRPFAPASILGQRGEDGSLSLTWARRDRGGSAWGDVPLPLTDPLSFRVRVIAEDGVTVIREWMVEAEAATYSAADRITDETDAEGPIKVSIAQMSADNNVGAGFSEVVTVNG